jgi:hypothetical protein
LEKPVQAFEASPRLPRIPELSVRWQSGGLNDAAYAALYFLYWQTDLYGCRFASRKSKRDPKPDPEIWLDEIDRSSGANLTKLLTGYFERHHFLGVIPNVPAALAAWLRGEWPLTLAERIPAPMEVLAMQIRGTRPVTVTADYPRLLRPVLKKANGLDFMVHDLEHAFKFFHSPELHAAQRKFFGLMFRAVRQGIFDPYRRDPVFSAQFDYVISDMNTHVVHSLRFLAATLIECLLRREGKTPRENLSLGAEQEMRTLLRSLGNCWKFPPEAEQALLNLVGGSFSEADAGTMEWSILGSGEPCF